MQRLVGKAAIVTGAGGGIGRAIARAFAREGASVLVVDIKAESVEETVRQIIVESGAERAFGLTLDLRDMANVKACVGACVEWWGRLDCIVNNAADLRQYSLEEITEEQWDATQAVNVKAIAWFAKEALPHLTAQPGSSLVNISSVRAHVAIPGGLAYDTSKAAVLGLTRLLAIELGPRGVRVNAICPGLILTRGEGQWEQMDERSQMVMAAPYALRRPGRPEEIARVAVFLASNEASFITGESINVDGGSVAMSPETTARWLAEQI